MLKCLESGFFCCISKPQDSVRSKYSRKPSWAKKILSDNQTRDQHSPSNKSMVDSIIGDFLAGSDIRLIFLDVDGTINHLDSDDTNVVGAICADCVSIFKQILDQTRSKIVLSSSWRLKKNLKKTLFRYLRNIDIAQGMVVGETRDLSDGKKNRTDEIKDWLANPYFYHDHEDFLPALIQSWVSLDDLNLAEMEQDEELKRNYIKLDPKLGLCKTPNIVTRVVQQMKILYLSYLYHDFSRFLSFSTASPGGNGRSSKRVPIRLSYNLRDIPGGKGSTSVTLMTHARSKTVDINLADDSYSSYDDDDSDLEHQPTLRRKKLLRAALERSQNTGSRCDWRKGAPRDKVKRNNLRRSESLPLLKLPPSLLEEQDVFQDGDELESFELGFDQQTNDE